MCMANRKRLLEQFNPDVFFDYSTGMVACADFIYKEFLQYSHNDIVRSIPSVIDGLKKCQRKILHCALQHSDSYKMEVLIGEVCGKTAYYHGEDSLSLAVIGMAQDFVGANNINLLIPRGQFGSRRKGGSDAGRSRYLSCQLNLITSLIIRHEDDMCIVYCDDDERKIESVSFFPVVPLLLINGARGVATGWSTSIPCFNPMDIVRNLRRMINGHSVEPMVPWYRDFKGTMEPAYSGFRSVGVVSVSGVTTIETSELPIGTWINSYKTSVLEPMMKDTYQQHNVNGRSSQATQSTVTVTTLCSESPCQQAP